MKAKLSDLRTPFAYLAIVYVLFMPACKVWNPNQLYKFPADFEYDDIPSTAPVTYIMAPGDIISIQLFTNGGYKLIDAGLAGVPGAGTPIQNSYLIDINGIARFPLIDTVSLAGLSIAEAEKRLETKYLQHVVEPWIQLNVLNRRAIVYLGDGQAVVVPLINERMTVLEIIASAGGIPSTARAYRIKLIREGKDEQSVSLIDLRDPSNARLGNILVQSNDVLIIDPAFETTFFGQITPFLSILTAFVAIYGLLFQFSN